MDATILLFGFTDIAQVKQLQGAFGLQKIRVQHVVKMEYGKPIGMLTGMFVPEKPIMPYLGGELSQRMVVFSGIEPERLNVILSTLKRCNVGTDVYKAMLTETNQYWTAKQLLEELMQERASMPR